MATQHSPGYREFVVLMAAMTALDAASIDSMVPALAQIGEDLQLHSANHRQWIINALFLGFGVGVFMYGFIADSIGRRKPTLFAFGIYALGTVICMQSSSMTEMVIGRGFQGFGAAGPYVLAITIIRDTYTGRKMAKVMSLVQMIFIGIPIVAPFAGQLVLLFAGWRSIFTALLFFGILTASWFWLRQPETLSPTDRLPLSVEKVWQNTLEVLRRKQTRSYLISMALATGAFIAYLSTAQQVFQDIYNTGTRFPIVFASLATAIGLSSWLNSRWVEALGMSRLLNRALAGVTVASIGYLILSNAWAETPPLWFYMMYLSTVMFCYGLIFGNLTSLALEPMGHIAGAASSVVNSFSMFGAIAISVLIGSTLNTSVLPVVIGFGTCCLTAWLLLRSIKRPVKDGL